MNINIKRATPADADQIAHARVMLLDEASGPLSDIEKDTLFASNKQYIENGLRNATLLSYLAFDQSVFIGTCSITLYQVMPGKKLPDGKQGYLQNMFIVPNYRRSGIGRRLVSTCIAEAAKLGHTRITLHATDMGRPLFSKFGFQEENVALTPMVYHTNENGGNRSESE